MDVTPRSIVRGPIRSDISRTRAGLPGITAGALRLEIGELVLHGFPAAHRHQLADACEGELLRLCGGRTPVQPTGNLDGASLSIVGGATPEATGTALARALHAVLYPTRP